MTVPDDPIPLLPSEPRSDPLTAALLALAEHEERLAQFRDLLGDVTTRLQVLERRTDGHPDRAGYTPIPAPRWWLLSAADRAEAIERLTAWVEQVYARSYGHLGVMLPHCWPEHDLCLFVLDFASELHGVLYLQPSRSARALADQAEFSLRILPAAAELMRAETARCDHPRASAHISPLANVSLTGTGSHPVRAPASARSFTSPGERT
jgi:hypothetical protein